MCGPFSFIARLCVGGKVTTEKASSHKPQLLKVCKSATESKE